MTLQPLAPSAATPTEPARLPALGHPVFLVIAEPHTVSVSVPASGTVARWQDRFASGSREQKFMLGDKEVVMQVEVSDHSATKVVFSSGEARGEFVIPPDGRVDHWGRIKDSAISFTQYPDYD